MVEGGCRNAIDGSFEAPKPAWLLFDSEAGSESQVFIAGAASGYPSVAARHDQHKARQRQRHEA